MRIFPQILSLFVMLCMLAGCDQREMLEKIAPKAEVDIVKALFARLAAKDLASVEKQLEPGLQTPATHAALEKMVVIFPSEQPRRINVVGFHASNINGVQTYNITLEYEYAKSWLVNNAVLQRKDGHVVVLGLHATPMKLSMEEAGRISFSGKSPGQYFFLALVVTIPLFILYALFRCVRTPGVRNKWAWILFIVVGFVQFSLNWAEGTFMVTPVALSLLGAGFARSGPYAPWILTVSIPVGAMVFLLMRRSWLARAGT